MVKLAAVERGALAASGLVETKKECLTGSSAAELESLEKTKLNS